MGRIALEDALKKPGRVITWHAGLRNRSHKSSRREDYITVVPRELAGLLHEIGSTTTLYEFMEVFIEELLHEHVASEVADSTGRQSGDSVPLLELRGYYERWMEFYVREVTPPLPDPVAEPGSFVRAINEQPARWLILANQNACTEERCLEGFETLLDVAEAVAKRFDLQFDLELVRNGLRNTLRRKTPLR